MPKLAGFFKPGVGNIVFSDSSNACLLRSVEIHEAIHAQLHETSHHGALYTYIERFRDRFSESSTQRRILTNIARALWASMHGVQEAIATLGGAAWLESQNQGRLPNRGRVSAEYFEYKGVAWLEWKTQTEACYKSYLSEKYLDYLKPVEHYLHENNFSELYIDGAVNLGLLAFNSPIIDRVAQVSKPESYDFTQLLANAELDPMQRMLALIEILKSESVRLDDLHLEGDFGRAVATARGHGVPIIGVGSSAQQYTRSSHRRLAESPLFGLDPGAQSEYINSVTFLDMNPQLQDFLWSGIAFLRRRMDPTRVSSQQFEQLVECGASEPSRFLPVLELRSEDLVSSGTDGRVRKLHEDQRIVGFFPLAGEEKYAWWTVIKERDVPTLVAKYRTIYGREACVTASSQYFNFQKLLWSDSSIRRPFVVVIPQGSVELVTRVIQATEKKGILRRRSKLYARRVVHGEEELQHFFVILHEHGKDRFFTILPATELIGRSMIELADQAGVEFIGDDFFETSSGHVLSTALTHLGGVGWANGDQAYENPSILVPETRSLRYSERISTVEALNLE